MLFISYRGIFDGQNFEDENTINQIGTAFNAGYSCMVDVWRVDDKIYLGSQQPLVEVTAGYIQGNRFWLNARNNTMLVWLQSQPQNLYPNYFSVPNPTPAYVTTSSGHQWVFGNVPTNSNSIIVLPEIPDRGLFSTVKLRNYGICSSYLSFIKRWRNEGVWY